MELVRKPVELRFGKSIVSKILLAATRRHDWQTACPAGLSFQQTGLGCLKIKGPGFLRGLCAPTGVRPSASEEVALGR